MPAVAVDVVPLSHCVVECARRAHPRPTRVRRDDESERRRGRRRRCRPPRRAEAASEDDDDDYYYYYYYDGIAHIETRDAFHPIVAWGRRNNGQCHRLHAIMVVVFVVVERTGRGGGTISFVDEDAGTPIVRALAREDESDRIVVVDDRGGWERDDDDDDWEDEDEWRSRLCR